MPASDRAIGFVEDPCVGATIVPRIVGGQLTELDRAGVLHVPHIVAGIANGRRVTPLAHPPAHVVNSAPDDRLASPLRAVDEIHGHLTSPASSPVRKANLNGGGLWVAGKYPCGFQQCGGAVPSSSDPAVPSTESKWAEITWIRSGNLVPLSVATTLAVRTPGRGSNHCTSGSYPRT